MPSFISRRSFLRRTASTGAILLAGRSLGSSSPLAASLLRQTNEQTPDIASVTGDNYYDATIRAVEILGGMNRFVSQGSNVGLLINSKFARPGTYVKPQIALAVLAMLRHAGAARIVSLDDTETSYWKRGTLSKEHDEFVRGIVGPGARKHVPLTGGATLKEIEIVREYVECDQIVNIAIFKDHQGTRFTGALKNIMGTTSGANNEHWHLGSGARGYYDDVRHLSQCIAEGNLVRTPSLCIGDATEVIIRNGPFGPGPTKNFRTVIASTDPVAFDAFGATLLGLAPDDIHMIRQAAALGIGTSRISTLRIERATL